MEEQLDEFITVSEVIKEKSILLKDHETKDFCLASVPFKNYEKHILENRVFFLVPNNVFNAIININLIQAQNKFPTQFGNGNAKDVIKALYDIEPWKDLEYYIKMLSREQFCYVVELVGQKVNPKVLRIDLYRKIKSNEEGGFDFIGGIFHCFKHFKYKGHPLSTGNDRNELIQPKDLVFKIIKAFFLNPLKPDRKNDFISEIEENRDYNLKFVFYYENKTKVYFIKTSYIENYRQ